MRLALPVNLADSGSMKCREIAGGWRGLLVCTIAALMLTSCATDDPDSPGVVRFSSSDMHAAHSEELLPVMHELTRLTVVEPDNLAAAEESARKQRRKARSILGKIASTANDIPDHLKTTTMPLEHQALFKHMSTDLSAQAKALRDDIRTLPLSAIKPRFTELQKSCDGCHRKFRIAPFPVSGGVPFD